MQPGQVAPYSLRIGVGQTKMYLTAASGDLLHAQACFPQRQPAIGAGT
jgi:hypothetical protein